ncbi:ribosome maturation factor RimM [Sandaracinobacteroides hominis]|uniref:ribosome maturation factor RimM n=1 Tax=Sandaracinobacteroides hominis TaxID=2780086 RepID=UPI002E2DB83F|nr:ribosome maturation factor RimM [Sandaracinobacteroides hominis]
MGAGRPVVLAAVAGARPVVLAAVAGAHGITGEVRLKLFTASPDGVKAHRQFDAGGRMLTLKALRPGPQGAVARFAEIGDRTAAEALRGTLLTVPRESLPALPEGEYYWHDLVGLPVFTSDGVEVGQVIGVENYGASDVLDILKAAGGSVLVPLIPAAVPEVGERVVVAAEWLV